MTKAVAIRKILGAWGVSNGDKLLAIKLVADGRHTPEKVVGVIEDIRDALGALETLRPDPHP